MEMERTVECCVMPSPIGPLTLLSDGQGLTGLYMDTGGEASAGQLAREGGDSPVLREARAQLDAYFTGRLTVFELPLQLEGTEFQRRVWAALCGIPYGETVSYRELAGRIGQPKAVRAVGLANGRNPVSIVVPCHRVIGADGTLTGYGGGLPRKRWLLDHERGVERSWLSLNLPEQA